MLFELVTQMFIFQFLFCPFLGIAQLTLGMNVSLSLCAAFIGRCTEVCGSISSSPSPSLSQCLSLLSVVVLTVMVALVSHWHAPIAPMSVTFIYVSSITPPFTNSQSILFHVMTAGCLVFVHSSLAQFLWPIHR